MDECQREFWAYSGQELGPLVLVVGAVCSQEPPQVLIGPLRLPVGLQVIARDEASCNAQPFTKSPSYLEYVNCRSMV